MLNAVLSSINDIAARYKMSYLQSTVLATELNTLDIMLRFDKEDL